MSGNRKVEPKFTLAQANEIRVAIDSTLQFRIDNSMDSRALRNALDELDRAQREVGGDGQ